MANKVETIKRIIRNRIKLARRSVEYGKPVRGIIKWLGTWFIPLDLTQSVGLKVGDKFTSSTKKVNYDIEIIQTPSGFTAIKFTPNLRR